MKLNKILTISIVVVIISAIGLAGVMFKMIYENSQCVDGPFQYSAEKLEESGGTYNCYCDSLDPQLLNFKFDKDGIYIDRPDIPFSYQEINFSNITLGPY